MRRILRRKKYVYIWAKYSLEDKQDKKLRKAFKEKLDEYLKLVKEKPADRGTRHLKALSTKVFRLLSYK